jgi:protein-disulfide isomerase
MRRSPSRRDALVALTGAVGGGFLGWHFLPPSERAAGKFLDANPGYIADNPKYLEAASSVLETRALAGQADQRRTLLAEQWLSKTDWMFCPRIGPSNGELGLVEFTDYFCAPCRGAGRPIESALKAYPQRAAALMFVPISGALSEYAAVFAAACYFLRPVPFARFHADLMEGPIPDQQRIEKTAEVHGYSIDAVMEKSNTPQVRNYLTFARQFAEAMGVTGLPAFLNPRGDLHRGGITARQVVGMMARNK